MSIRQGKIIIADSVSSTTDYQDLINKPKINGVELDGNKTTEDLNIDVGITSVNGDTGTNGAVTVKAIENANPNDTMLKVWNGTTAEYLALAEKDLNTIYNVTDEVTADTSKISGFNLFDFKWSDHLINNISWTRADNFSWHSAAVYVSAYNKLLKEKERASTVLETETIDDITISFYRSENNYKICLPDQLANLTSLYEKTGVAWYYVIDTENKQFKLPRTKWGFTGLRNKAGDYVPESLPNITGSVGAVGDYNSLGTINGAFEKVTPEIWTSSGGTAVTGYNTTFDAFRSSSTYQDNAPVQERATEMYLYFYVGNTVIVESEVNLDTLVTDVENLKKGSGGSLEIGDIGFSAFGIDETKNLRRYLNGQVISQAQFVQFTSMLKSRVSVYPNLATTETNWQAEVTNSKLGQCGKFVIDDNAGTIRLPKVVNIQGLQDLSLLGGIKAESLPNIKGIIGATGQNGAAYGIFYEPKNSGAFKVVGSPSQYTVANGEAQNSRYINMDFDASRSSSTYQDGAKVQQEAVQYPYFIQVATGVEESVDVTREIELNNPFSLFESKWADHELSNASWVKSNGTFYSGATYVTAYNELLTEYNNAASVEKTDGSITYKLTPKGFKIALASQDAAITELYNNTGVAWYYVLDTANTQFKLPRTKWGFVGIRNAVGSYVAESLPNIAGTFTDNSTAVGSNFSAGGVRANGALYLYQDSGASGGKYASAVGPSQYGIGFDASRSSSTYQDGAPVQQRATEMYLYFYVGETIQDANVINAAGVLTDVANLKNNKADKDLSNVSALGKETVVGWGMPDFSAGVDIPNDTYTQLPVDAFVSIKGATPGNVTYGINVSLDGINTLFEDYSESIYGGGSTQYLPKGIYVKPFGANEYARYYPLRGAK